MALPEFLTRARAADANAVRPPAVAGRFYPDDPHTLRRAIETLLAKARPSPPRAEPPVAIVAPHAGYV